MARHSRRNRRPAGVYILLIVVIALAAGLVWYRTGVRPAMSSQEAKAAAEQAIDKFKAAKRIDPRTVIFDVQVVESGDEISVSGVLQDKQTLSDLLAAVRKAAGRGTRDELRVLPDANVAAKPYAIVSVPVVNLGDGPKSDTGKNMVTQAILGNVMDILEETTGWYRVRMHDQYLGWVDGKSLTLGDRGMVDSFTGGRQAVIMAKFATVHATADTASPNLLSQEAVQGTILPVAGEQPGWVNVKLPDGRVGWLQASEVRVVPSIKDAFPVGDANGIITIAKQYIDLAYLWGGTSAYGYDCSGFTQFSYRMNGYALPRDADMQYAAGQVVEGRSALKPGDLVFFSTYKSGPSHVGIYIGNSLYIHSGSRGVAVNSFDPKAPEYSQDLDQKYLGARRFIK